MTLLLSVLAACGGGGGGGSDGGNTGNNGGNTGNTGNTGNNGNNGNTGNNGGNGPGGNQQQNQPPTAVAQISLPAAYSSQSVVLDGSQSHDDGGAIASYEWNQVGGPAVSISDASASLASFQAPPVSELTELRFRLTVTDDEGASADTEVQMTVEPADVQFTIELVGPRPFLLEDELATLRRTTARFDGRDIDPVSQSWSSDVAGNLAGSAAEIVAALQPGAHLITVSADFGELGTVRRSKLVRVLPRRIPTTPFQETPAANHVIEMPIVAVTFIPTVDGERVDDSVVGMRRPAAWSSGLVEDLQTYVSKLLTRTKFMLEEGSRFHGYKDASAVPYLGYRVVDHYVFYEPFKAGAPYPSNPAERYADMHDALARIPLKNLVEEAGVKEVWIFAYENPNAFIAESNMSSPFTGDISNSFRHPDDLPVFEKTYVVYGNNYHRTQAEAAHVHGHQIESVISYMTSKIHGSDAIFWEDFVGIKNGKFTSGHCGATHFPLNARGDYDYLNDMDVVLSDCEDWRPDGTGLPIAASLSTWADIPYAWPEDHMDQREESHWYIYWMQNIPGYNNGLLYEGKELGNWWDYVAKWDELNASTTTPPSAPSATPNPVLSLDLVEESGRPAHRLLGALCSQPAVDSTVLVQARLRTGAASAQLKLVSAGGDVLSTHDLPLVRRGSLVDVYLTEVDVATRSFALQVDAQFDDGSVQSSPPSKLYHPTPLQLSCPDTAPSVAPGETVTLSLGVTNKAQADVLDVLVHPGDGLSVVDAPSTVAIAASETTTLEIRVRLDDADPLRSTLDVRVALTGRDDPEMTNVGVLTVGIRTVN